MKKKSFTRMQLATWVTLLIIVLLGGCYFFIYLPYNERKVQELRFRCLQNVDINLKSKVDNSVSMMDSLVASVIKAGNNDQKVKQYIADVGHDIFKLKYFEGKSGDLAAGERFNHYHVSINKLSDSIVITSIRVDGINYRGMALSYKISAFFKSLLPPDVFDEYIVFNDSIPIYESMPAGITRVKKDSLVNARNGIWATTVKDLAISGNDYKMFLQPVRMGESECFIGGLLLNSRYQQEKTQLPPGVVMFLAVIVLLILLSMPWIKLTQIGSKDRITSGDPLISAMTSMLIMSLLFFLFTKYNYPLRRDSSDQYRKNLADTIARSFDKETHNAYDAVKRLDAIRDTMMKRNNKGDYNLVYLSDTGKIKWVDEGQVNNEKAWRDSICLLNKRVRLLQAFWLDKEGLETTNWNAEAFNAPHGYFKDRKYFTNFKEGDNYFLDGDTSKRYYLDQLISRTAGTFRSVISVPSKTKDSVAVLSFDYKYLSDMTLPEGFKYCIIGKDSKVLYHSISSKNLNEYLLQEFSDKDLLKSVINARETASFKTVYYTRDYEVYIRPLQGLPYFMVILEDLGFKQTRDIEIFLFTISVMFILFGFMAFQMLVAFIVSARRNYLNKHFADISWIAPKISNYHEYNAAVIASLLIIILLRIYFNSGLLAYTFILFFSASFISFFLVALYEKKYRKTDKINRAFKLNAMLWLGICILLLNVLACFILDNCWSKFLSFELIAVLLCLPIYLFAVPVMEKMGRLPAFLWDYKKAFTTIALARLLITSGIPVMFYYVSSFNYEQALDVKYRHLQFGNLLAHKLNIGDTVSTGNEHADANVVYSDNNFIKRYTQRNLPGAFASISREDSLSFMLFNMPRLHLTSNAVNNSLLYKTNSFDHSYFGNNILADGADSVETALQLSNPKQYLDFYSGPYRYTFPAGKKAILFWGLLAFCLFFFYKALSVIIKKLFALDAPDLSAWKKFDDDIIRDANLNKLLFIVGLPGASKLPLVMNKIANNELGNDPSTPLVYIKDKDGDSNVFVADLTRIPDAGEERENEKEWSYYKRQIFSSKNRLIIFDHFEYNSQDLVTSRIKLNLVEKALMQGNLKVVILSTIHPVSFLESFYEKLARSDERSVPGFELERWHVLLGQFKIVIFPIFIPDETTENSDAISHNESEFQPQPVQKYTPQQLNKVADTLVGRAAIAETSRTYYLNMMQDVTLQNASDLADVYGKSRIADELPLKLQMTAQYYYMYIWQSLTKEEKFLLYDLAEDDLVNSFDDYNLNMLICKGVIIKKDGSLKIFNKGFRNFILTAIGNYEVMQIRNQIRDNGNWNKIRQPLNIIFITLLVFLFSSQQEVFTKIITSVAVLGTSIPAVIRFLSLFGRPKSPTGLPPAG